MSAHMKAAAAILGTCKCGKRYESYYSAFYEECQSCERRREAEGYIGADMISWPLATGETPR